MPDKKDILSKVEELVNKQDRFGELLAYQGEVLAEMRNCLGEIRKDMQGINSALQHNSNTAQDSID